MREYGWRHLRCEEEDVDRCVGVELCDTHLALTAAADAAIDAYTLERPHVVCGCIIVEAKCQSRSRGVSQDNLPEIKHEAGCSMRCTGSHLNKVEHDA